MEIAKQDRKTARCGESSLQKASLTLGCRLQAGRPKTITGFQTHTTPVLLSAGERAELASEKYLPLSPVLEGVVILRPNPHYLEVAE